MKKILVTGAGGFIGYHLANFLADSGHSVVGVDIHYPEKPVDGKPPRFTALTGDFRDQALLEKALEQVNVVFHLASAHLQISLDESEYWDINVHSLKPLLKLSQQKGVSRFIHVSSVGIYGNLTTLPASEETECHPQSIYGETKLAGEGVVKQYAVENDFPVVIIRPAWVYGPGCPRTQKLYRTLKKKRFVMIGRGDNLRHPIYIADMLEGFRLAMEHDAAVGETFLIAGDRAITTRELVDGFVKVLGTPGPVVSLPYGVGVAIAATAETVFGVIGKEPPLSRRTLEFFDTNNAFDIGKAKKVLNFNPRFSFEDGLKESRPWLENHT